MSKTTSRPTAQPSAAQLREEYGNTTEFAIRVAELLLESDLVRKNGQLKMPFATACKQLFSEADAIRWNNVRTRLRQLDLLTGQKDNLRLKRSAPVHKHNPHARKPASKKVTVSIDDPAQPTAQEILFRVVTTDDPVDKAFYYPLDLHYRIGEKARKIAKELLGTFSPEDVSQILRVARQGVEVYIAAREAGM